MSKLEIHASKSSVQISAEGVVALIIGTAVAITILVACAYYVTKVIWVA
jgi:hypothetical protein